MASETAVRSNTEIVREYTQRVFNEHDPGLSSEYFAPEVKWHGGLLGTVEGSESVTGMLRGFIGALPDLHATEQDLIAAGDTVAVRYVVEATHEVSRPCPNDAAHAFAHADQIRRARDAR